MVRKKLYFISFLPPNKSVIGGLDVFTRQIFLELQKDEEFLSKYEPFFVVFKGAGKRWRKDKINMVEFRYDDSKSILENNTTFKSFLNSHISKDDVVITNDWFGIPSQGKRLEIVHSLEHHHSLLLGQEENTIREEEKRAIEGAKEVITVSNIMREEIEKYHNRESKVMYLSHSLPLPEPQGREGAKAREDGKVSLLFVGRLERQKNVENLLKALSLLPEPVKQKIELNIVGVGTMETKLKKYSSYLKLSDVVSFLGRVSDKNLISLYTASHAFIIPSYFEPFGIACYDAYLYTLPILSTQKAGCLELLEQHKYKNIATFDPYVPYSITEAIEYFLSHHKPQKLRATKKPKKIRTWQQVWEELKHHIINME